MQIKCTRMQIGAICFAGGLKGGKILQGYASLTSVCHTAKLWLLVIEEEDLHGAHYVKSVYFTPEIKDDEVLCIRRIPAIR